jgi:nucleoside-diphosphate-sugar epimerase
MRVLVAGATGSVGRPMVAQLTAAGHHVLGLTRNAASARQLEASGGAAVVADVLDRDALLRALEGASADAVIHQLTALSKAPMRAKDMEATNRLRTTGTAHLLEAAEALGAKRFVVQSFFGGYGFRDHGTEPLPERAPFGETTGGPADRAIAALRSAEEQVRASAAVAGVALRYGFFYGADGMPDMVRRRLIPVPNRGGLLPWIHHEDAARAAVAALERGRAGGVYNIADDQPASWREVMTAMAGRLGARPPRVLPTWALRLGAPFTTRVVVDTTMVLSTAAALDELDWSPRYPSYREGLHTVS